MGSPKNTVSHLAWAALRQPSTNFSARVPETKITWTRRPYTLPQTEKKSPKKLGPSNTHDGSMGRTVYLLHENHTNIPYMDPMGKGKSPFPGIYFFRGSYLVSIHLQTKGWGCVLPWFSSGSCEPRKRNGLTFHELNEKNGKNGWWLDGTVQQLLISSLSRLVGVKQGVVLN